MLSIFRTNQLLASILLTFYIVLVRISVWFVPENWEPSGYGPLSAWVYQWIGHSGTTPNLVAIVLLLLQATFLNYIISEHRLADTVSLFPGLFYVLASSLLPELLHLSPLLMANTFLLLSINEIFATYKKTDCADRIYNIGFWIGIAVLFYPAYLVFLILAFSGLNILRAFKFKERLMVLTGLLTPFLLLSAYAFWQRQLMDFLQSLKDGLGFLDFTPSPAFPTYRSLAVFAILILVVLFSYRSYQYKQVIEVQRKINILFWALLASAFSLLIQANIQIDLLLITTIPIGVMLSINFIRMPTRMAEVIHLLILAGALALQFWGWLTPGS